MTEDNSPPFRWPLAHATKVIHGKDRVARVVDVLTTFRRPAISIRCLPLELTDEVSQVGRHVLDFGLDFTKESTNGKLIDFIPTDPKS